MRPFRDQPIRRKLTLALMATSAAVLLAATAAIFAETYRGFRADLLSSLHAQAEIAADNASALLAFGDEKTATASLSVLHADPHILAACIYTTDGTLFARYIRADQPESPLPPPPSLGIELHRFTSDFLEHLHPISVGPKIIGTLLLRTSLEALNQRLLRYAGIVALVLVASLLLAYWLSNRFQHLIADPMLRLADAAHQVSDEKNFATRVHLHSRDELGRLAEAFNRMLEQIGRADAEIRDLNAGLEQRVRARTAELQAAVHEIESFSYSVSHDLRAPLRGIDGWSLALVEDYSDRLDDHARDYLARIRSDAQRMSTIIDDLLNLSRINRGDLIRTPTDLSALATRLLDQLRATDPSRSVECFVTPGLSTVGDSTLLELLLQNLLANAWKFTSKHPTARIEFGQTDTPKGPAFFVRDNGAGFDMVHAPKLFTPFNRLHKPSDFPGTGIGLTIVQRVARRHGGHVWAEASLNLGATFYFSLPSLADNA